MLIPKNISPDDCVYYNASFILDVLLKKGELTLADLFCEVRKKRYMTFSFFVLCMDWLYLIDCVTLKQNKVVLCS